MQLAPPYGEARAKMARPPGDVTTIPPLRARAKAGVRGMATRGGAAAYHARYMLRDAERYAENTPAKALKVQASTSVHNGTPRGARAGKMRVQHHALRLYSMARNAAPYGLQNQKVPAAQPANSRAMDMQESPDVHHVARMQRQRRCARLRLRAATKI